MSGDPRRELGKRAEDAACAWLRRRGWRIIERNYRCREGEIDVIARRGDLTAFCEVRARSGSPLVEPPDTVDAAKRRKLTLAARRYLQGLQERGSEPGSCRFDVISVTAGGKRLRIEHIEDAFPEVD